jgi:Tfp pilus assembly protein PilN
MTTPALCLDYQRVGSDRGRLRALLLLLGLTAAGAISAYEWHLAGEIAQREAELGRMKEQALPRKAVRVNASPRQLEEEVQRAKGVIQQLTLPWDRMFAAIESSDDRGIALLAIQPDAEKRRITIGGEAKNLLVMLDYVRRLEHSGALARVYVTNHEVQQQDPQKPVRFMLEASWAVSP